MARVELPVVVKNTQTGLPVSGAAIRITNRITGVPVGWYATETGGAASTAALFTDASGRASGWLDRGAYLLTITGTGINPTTSVWDASPGGDNTLDTVWLADAQVTNAKVDVSGIDASKFSQGTLPSSVLGANSISSLLDFSVTAAAMGVGGRLINAIPLTGGTITPSFANASFSAATAVQTTHSSSPGFYILLHSMQATLPGSPAFTPIKWAIMQDAITLVTFNETLHSQTSGFGPSRQLVIKAGTYGKLNGSHTWGVNVDATASNGSAGVSVSVLGDGLLLLFETY